MELNALSILYTVKVCYLKGQFAEYLNSVIVYSPKLYFKPV